MSVVISRMFPEITDDYRKVTCRVCCRIFQKLPALVKSNTFAKNIKKTMAGMEFEYDEEGSTFFYFLLSFWALIIIPATYYGWPRAPSEGKYGFVISVMWHVCM